MHVYLCCLFMLSSRIIVARVANVWTARKGVTVPTQLPVWFNATTTTTIKQTHFIIVLRMSLAMNEWRDTRSAMTSHRNNLSSVIILYSVCHHYAWRIYAHFAGPIISVTSSPSNRTTSSWMRVVHFPTHPQPYDTHRQTHRKRLAHEAWPACQNAKVPRV